MRKFFLNVVIIIASLIFFETSTLRAQSNIYKLQSLFIYNFIKNIKWESIDNEFTIGVFGSPEVFTQIKSSLINKNVNGKNFKIVKVTTKEEAEKCHLVYLTNLNHSKVIAMLNELNSQNLLIVTEEDLIEEGASISFIVNDAKMNFIINRAKTEKSGLKVSSSLMAMGQVVG